MSQRNTPVASEGQSDVDQLRRLVASGVASPEQLQEFLGTVPGGAAGVPLSPLRRLEEARAQLMASVADGERGPLVVMMRSIETGSVDQSHVAWIQSLVGGRAWLAEVQRGRPDIRAAIKKSR